MFETPQCALKSNQPSVSGTNCNEKMSENAFCLALNRRYVLLWWCRSEVVSGPNQAQSPGAWQIDTSPCSLWVSGCAVSSGCGILLVGVFCSSLCFPTQNAVQKPHLCVIKAGLEGCLQKQRLLPSYQMCACIKKKRQYQRYCWSLLTIAIICSMGTTSCSIVL